MSDTNTRYKADWYTKRINQNMQASHFFISKINQYKEADFPWTTRQLMYLNNEDLTEIAVATINKRISITLGAGSDYDNGVDAKFSVVRSNSRGKSYASLITCTNKEFIVAVVYENIQSKFYFFAFPCTLKQHSIPFDPATGVPIRANYMWQYECDSFEEMAMSSFDSYPKLKQPVFDNLFEFVQ
jgi:hypothetical protein